MEVRAGASLPPRVAGPVVAELELHVPLVGFASGVAGPSQCLAKSQWWGTEDREAAASAQEPVLARAVRLSMVTAQGARAGWQRCGGTGSIGELSTHRSADSTVLHPVMASIDAFLRYCRDMVSTGLAHGSAGPIANEQSRPI